MAKRNALEWLQKGHAKLWLILVGIKAYQDERFTTLRFSLNDCHAVEGILRRATRAFNNVELIIHHDEAMSPDRSSVLSSLQRIDREADPQDTVLFYFTGHCLLNASHQPILCLQDTDWDSFDHSGLAMQTVLDYFQHCDQRVMLLDTCYSGGINTIWRQALRNLEGDFVALVSSDSTERSWDDSKKAHSVFTDCVVQAIEHVAQANSGEIWVSKLFAEVNHLFRLNAVDKQEPLFIGCLKDILVGYLKLGGFDKYLDALKKFEQICWERIRQHEPLDSLDPQAIEAAIKMLVDIPQKGCNLGISPSDINMVTERAEHSYKMALAAYIQECRSAIRTDFPLSDYVIKRLQTYENRFDLIDSTATNTQQIDSPLSDRAIRSLQPHQHRLGLTDSIATDIQQKVAQAYCDDYLKLYEAKLMEWIREHDTLDISFVEHWQQQLQLDERHAETIRDRVVDHDQQRRQGFQQALANHIGDHGVLSPKFCQQQRERYDLNRTVAKMIQTEVKENYHARLHQYDEQLQQMSAVGYPLTDVEWSILPQLRSELGLSAQVTAPLEQTIFMPLEHQWQTIQQTYANRVDTVIRKLEYLPQFLAQITSNLDSSNASPDPDLLELQPNDRDFLTVSLHQIQQGCPHLRLSADIAANVVTTQVKDYTFKLHRYYRAVINVASQQYPWSNDAEQQLVEQEKSLQLQPQVTEQIRQRICAAYTLGLQQYETEFQRIVIQHYPHQESCREGLNQLLDNLRKNGVDLSKNTIRSIESRFLQPYQNYERLCTNLLLLNKKQKIDDLDSCPRSDIQDGSSARHQLWELECQLNLSDRALAIHHKVETDIANGTGYNRQQTIQQVKQIIHALIYQQPHN